MKKLSPVAENRRIPKEVEKTSLDMRTRKPRRRQIPAVEDAALGNDAIIDVGGVVESQDDGAAAESGEKILEEVEFEEIVQENSIENG